MTTATLDVVGTALYIEATRTNGSTKYVTQLLVTPEVTLGTGTPINMAMYRRRISTAEPRKTWRHYSSSTNSKRALESKGLVVASAIDESVSDDMLNFIRPTLNTLCGNTSPDAPYTIVGQPICVEVTAADMEDIRLGKTPYKIFGRVWKSRKKLGFPENFL